MTGQPQSMKTRLIQDVAEVKADQLRLLLITDLKDVPRDRHLDTVEAALKGGVRDLQLREKDLPLRDLFSLAVALRQLTSHYGARLYINDRVDVALMVQADGVHLPEAGLPAGEVKARYPQLLVGVSTHSLESAVQAQEDGADYITFSPIYDTPSKRQYGAPQGVDALKEVAGRVNLPVLALGGINLERIPEVMRAGAHGAALIRGIWNSTHIENASSKYIQAIKGES
ncbi:thiamine phosphate synthase [Nitrospina gracilis]|uniref:thiamine phosphate synthase n=1 Tax=Nitrospina gracilis TaxID=35801 RepID=UPI001F01EDBD|nr:thiamine phosphate synthase [Nitrospina gracilis]MCF8721964.1 thiamine-phosphate pyrophosphorylase [Nitrospina gracilis Nb-211]